MNDRLDVIVPTIGRSRRIQPLVKMLIKQLGRDERIFIVWQGGECPFTEDSGSVRLLHCTRENLPASRNAGIAESTADIVLFLDDDVEPSAGCLEGHRRAHCGTAIGAVTGRIDDPLFDKRTIAPSFLDMTKGEYVLNFSLTQSQEATSVMGANVSFRRSALDLIGGFDPCFSGNALWEDVDCALRLRKAGFRLWYAADAPVKHLRDPHGGCRRGSKTGYIYHQFANTAYFAARHAEPENYGAWLHYWKYRLEFISRKVPDSGPDRTAHSPLLVSAAMLGAAAGMIRYLLFGRGLTNRIRERAG